MSNSLPFPDRNALVAGQIAGFRAVCDDFSVKIDRVDDALFWLRLEFGSSSQVVVTDLSLGATEPSEAALALAQGMEILGQSSARRFLIRDVAPTGKVTERLEQCRAILGSHAKRRALFVADWQVLTQGQKIDILATLGR